MDRVVDQRDAGVDDLAQIMRRDVGRHADRDAAGTVDQKVRVARRQDRRLIGALVVVGPKIDGVLVDLADDSPRCTRQARLGVAHRRRRIAVLDAEIALAIDQRQAQGEVLRHADHGVVDRDCRRADGTCPSRRPRCGQTCLWACPDRSRFPSSHNRIRRCTGFSPSRTSGNARATITLIA